MANEREAIRRIKAGESLEGIKDGLQLGFIVDGTTVIHQLAQHNMLTELHSLLMQKPESEVSRILNTKSIFSTPLDTLVTHILLDDSYPTPGDYKDMICFLQKNSVDVEHVIRYLLLKKAHYRGKEDLVDTIDALLSIMEDCDPVNVPKIIAAAMHVYEETMAQMDADYAQHLAAMDAKYGTWESIFPNSTETLPGGAGTVAGEVHPPIPGILGGSAS